MTMRERAGLSMGMWADFLPQNELVEKVSYELIGKTYARYFRDITSSSISVSPWTSISVSPWTSAPSSR